MGRCRRATMTAAAGTVQDLFLDARAASPPGWSSSSAGCATTRLVAVPLRDCAGAAFGVWVAQEAEALRSAPVVDPTRPLRREHELAICAHYGGSESHRPRRRGRRPPRGRRHRHARRVMP